MLTKLGLFLCVILMSFAAGWFAHKPKPCDANAKESLSLSESSKSQTSEDETRTIERTIQIGEAVTHEIIKEKILTSSQGSSDVHKTIEAVVPSKEEKKGYSLLFGAKLGEELMSDKIKLNPVVGLSYDFNKSVGIQGQYSIKDKEATFLIRKSL